MKKSTRCSRKLPVRQILLALFATMELREIILAMARQSSIKSIFPVLQNAGRLNLGSTFRLPIVKKYSGGGTLSSCSSQSLSVRRLRFGNR